MNISFAGLYGMFLTTSHSYDPESSCFLYGGSPGNDGIVRLHSFCMYIIPLEQLCGFPCWLEMALVQQTLG